jgi:hypothetical protein
LAAARKDSYQIGLLFESRKVPLLPAVTSYKRKAGYFALPEGRCNIWYDDRTAAEMKAFAHTAAKVVETRTGNNAREARSESGREPEDGIFLKVDASLETGAEGYKATVTPQQVVITAQTVEGTARGFAALAQLLEKRGDAWV